MQNAFSLRNVTYRTILSIPSLDVATGSVFGITGKSGSGKTTLLKLLNNLITSDTGTVNYFGTDVLKIDPVTLRRKVMMVPQAPYIFPGTILENIQLIFNFNRKELPVQVEIESLLELFDMPGMLNKKTANMSGGEKQRLALARVLLLDPETLLLDEPTAALDDENARAVFEYLAWWVGKSGKAVVMISHSEALISEFGGSILALSGGQINSFNEEGSVHD